MSLTTDQSIIHKLPFPVFVTIGVKVGVFDTFTTADTYIILVKVEK